MLTITLFGGPNDGDVIRRKDELPDRIWTDGIPGHVTIYVSTLQNRHCYVRITATRYEYREKCTQFDDTDKL